MKFKIPKQFELMGQTIRVVYDKKLCHENDNRAEARYRSNEIAINPPSECQPWPQEHIGEAFFHELVHFIFHMAGEKTMASDERIVGVVGNLLHQAIKTMR